MNNGARTGSVVGGAVARVVVGMALTTIVCARAFGSGGDDNGTVRTIYGANVHDAVRTYVTGLPGTVLQRLYLPPQSEIQSITFELHGPASETAGHVIAYGHEGGLIAPRLGARMLRIPFRKSTNGDERITVELDPPLLHKGGQLFLGVEGIAPNTRVLLVDDRTVVPCTDASGVRAATVYSYNGVDWGQTPMPMAMSVRVFTPTRPEELLFSRDTTLDAVADRHRATAPYITMGDVDGDGYPEFCAAGVLFKNDRGRFQSIDLQSDTATYPYLYFLDVDGDGRDEILAVDIVGGGDARLMQWHGRRLSTMQTTASAIPGTIVSVSTIREGNGADIVALVQRAEGARPYHLGITPAGAVVATEMHGRWFDDARSVMSADVTGDGRPELFVRTVTSDLILTGTVKDGFEPLTERHYSDSTLVDPTATLLHRTTDTLVISSPRSVSWRSVREGTESTKLVLDKRLVMLFDELPDYDERPSSIIDADLTGDGIPERMVFGSGTCRALRVYGREADQWKDVTYSLGLFPLFGAHDAVVADVDRDGKPEVIVDRNGQVECYRQTRSGQPIGPVASFNSPTTPTSNAAVLVYGRGRGHLMQDGAHRMVMETTEHPSTSISTVHITATQDGWVVRGLGNETTVDISINSITGATVHQATATVVGGEIVLPASSIHVASGTYTMHVRGQQTTSSCIIHIVQ